MNANKVLVKSVQKSMNNDSCTALTTGAKGNKDYSLFKMKTHELGFH